MSTSNFWQRTKQEYTKCTQGVNPELVEYIESEVFDRYAQNDKAHGIIHILEVIRRSFLLNQELDLGLDNNMVFAIAACHDIGKYINSDEHHLIAAQEFMKDDNMKKFFTGSQRLTIKEAIEDHRSSKEDSPRSDYGKLVSSADRNTRVDMVFIRSFFVAKARMPEENMEDYLDYTIKRLSKRYSIENPENMFFEDDEYRDFLTEMRDILQKDEEFKTRYCKVNHITDRNSKVKDNEGETEYFSHLTPTTSTQPQQ